MKIDHINEITKNIQNFEHYYMNSNEKVRSGDLVLYQNIFIDCCNNNSISLNLKNFSFPITDAYNENILLDKICIVEYFNVSFFKKPILLIYSYNQYSTIGNITFVFDKSEWNFIKVDKSLLFNKQNNIIKCNYINYQNQLDDNFIKVKDLICKKLCGKLSRKIAFNNIIKKSDDEYTFDIPFNIFEYYPIRKLKKIEKGIDQRKKWYKDNLNIPWLHFQLNGENIFKNEIYVSKKKALEILFNVFYKCRNKKTNSNVFEIFCTKYKNEFSHKETILKIKY